MVNAYVHTGGGGQSPLSLRVPLWSPPSAWKIVPPPESKNQGGQGGTIANCPPCSIFWENFGLTKMSDDLLTSLKYENVNKYQIIICLLSLFTFSYLPNTYTFIIQRYFLSDIERYSISWHHFQESTILHRINSWGKYVDLRKCK